MAPDSDDDQAAKAAEDPHWLRDALAIPFIQKVRALGAALWFFGRRPWSFGEAWFRGAENIPNPLVAMAAAVSVLTLLSQEARRILKREEAAHTLLSSLGDTLAPYLVYIATGLVAHVVLRALGSKRKIRTTIGISLLAGAGPGTVLAVCLATPTLLLLAGSTSSGDVALDALNAHLSRATQAAIAIPSLGLYVYFLALFELALAGAHGLARWKGVVAGTVAILAVGVACGVLDQADGRLSHVTEALGPHLSLFINRKGRFSGGFIM